LSTNKNKSAQSDRLITWFVTIRISEAAAVPAAAAAVAGLFGATFLLNKPLSYHKILFLGAGAAGLGIADLVVKALTKEGISKSDAIKSCWFRDSKGLVVKSRWEKLTKNKQKYAHEFQTCDSFLEIIDLLKPTCIIGVSGQGGSFTKEIIDKMAEINDRPIIFALSNPTSKAECSAKQAYEWTNGKAIFASGSPFDPVLINGKKYTPGQGNNSYIFPGVGLGIVASKAKHVTEEMFLAAAESLAKQVNDSEKEMECIYPSLERIRDVSYQVALAVANEAINSGYSNVLQKDIKNLITKSMVELPHPQPELLSSL